MNSHLDERALALLLVAPAFGSVYAGIQASRPESYYLFGLAGFLFSLIAVLFRWAIVQQRLGSGWDTLRRSRPVFAASSAVRLLILALLAIIAVLVYLQFWPSSDHQPYEISLTIEPKALVFGSEKNSTATGIVTVFDRVGLPLKDIVVRVSASTPLIRADDAKGGDLGDASTDVVGRTDSEGRFEFELYANPAASLGGGSLQVIVATESKPIVVSDSISIVGPPAVIFGEARPDRVMIGEVVTLTAAVTDAIGQNVADGTPMKIVAANAKISPPQEVYKTSRGAISALIVPERAGPLSVVISHSSDTPPAPSILTVVDVVVGECEC